MLDYPQIVQESCNGCGLCVMVCSNGVLALVYNLVVVCNSGSCVYCTNCESVCETGAIRCPYEIIIDCDHFMKL